MDRDWSLSLFEERLIAAFREMQGRGVFSPRVGELVLIKGQRINGIELIMLCQSVLGRRSVECTALLTWARAQAGGPSLSGICAEMGWSRSTIESARRRGARRVCDVIAGAAPAMVA